MTNNRVCVQRLHSEVIMFMLEQISVEKNVSPGVLAASDSDPTDLPTTTTETPPGPSKTFFSIMTQYLG